MVNNEDELMNCDIMEQNDNLNLPMSKDSPDKLSKVSLISRNPNLKIEISPKAINSPKKLNESTVLNRSLVVNKRWDLHKDEKNHLKNDQAIQGHMDRYFHRTIRSNRDTTLTQASQEIVRK